MTLDKGRLNWYDGDRDPSRSIAPPQEDVALRVLRCAHLWRQLIKLPAAEFQRLLHASPTTRAARQALPQRSRHVDHAGDPAFEWANKDTFQIISAGLDDHYGSELFLADHLSYPVYPDGVNYHDTGRRATTTTSPISAKAADCRT